MNNAPVVYVPTQPEGNGLTLPTLLSLLAHGIVLGILIYTYQQPKLEMVGSIETTMVTPGELAEMQGQILANRAAAQAQAASSGSSASTAAQTNEFNSSAVSQNNASSSSQQVPVFVPSDESNRPILMSEEQQQRLSEQTQDYERNIAEWSAELDDATMNRLDQVEQDRRQQQTDEQRQLNDFRAAQNDQPRVNRPTKDERNINIELGGSNSSGKSFDLSEGQSTASGGSSSGTSNKSSGGSRGASNSEIINLIKRSYNPPTGAKGSTQRTTLSITVNASGSVVSVSASGSNEAVNEAAKQAVRNAGSLPIDVDDPKYPTFTIQFNGSN